MSDDGTWVPSVRIYHYYLTFGEVPFLTFLLFKCCTAVP